MASGSISLMGVVPGGTTVVPRYGPKNEIIGMSTREGGVGGGGGAPLAAGRGARGDDGRAEVRAEERDHRDEHEVGEHAARRHDGRDLRPDDVADAQERRVRLDRDRSVAEGLAEDL